MTDTARGGFAALGRFVAAHPWAMIMVWTLIIALGVSGELRLPQAAIGGSTGIVGSDSKAVDDALRTEFTNPFINPLVVAVDSPGQRIDASPAYRSWTADTAQSLAALASVRKVESFVQHDSERLRSADAHITLLLVGPAAQDVAGQNQAVRDVRQALVARRAALQSQDPAATLAVTGGPAATLDLNTWSASGGDRAEKSALPLTLLILIIAFGTPLAAGLPFLMGLATTSVALGAAFVLATLMPVSNLLGNVVTMVGLAVGIDYSLLMVTHYREHLPATDLRAAVASTIAESGQTIAWSGMTVMLGLLGLLFSPILETRSVGIGGALVVCISVLAALTLLPAVLVLLGKWIDRWPVFKRAHHTEPSAPWRRIGTWIVKHPLRILLVSGAAVVTLALPVLWARSGFTNEPWFLARGMEARAGTDIVSRARDPNASLPLQVIVRSADQQSVLSAAHLPALYAYAQQLKNHAQVASVDSPVTLSAQLDEAGYRALYHDPEQALRSQPDIAETYLSRDRRAALFTLTPQAGLSMKQIQQLASELQRLPPGAGLSVTFGGAAVYDNDFNRTMHASLPRVFGFVIAATLLLLFAAFRSYLLPFKAVTMNLLAVAAGYGVVVAVFQFGWLHSLVGLEKPFDAIPLEVPLMVFCLSFGLSMDYELFLLFRIQSEFQRDCDNNRATVEGLAAVAPVITSAGLIMAVVFGAFAAAPLPVLKMIGVGLCVAVLVDASLIRGLVVPSFMAIAGRWNWYPGLPPGC